MIEIVSRISSRLASKFKFGYHEVDDMKQQVFLEILKPDRNGTTILEKFDPEKGNSLDSFLWIHARNRLHNFKRDNFARPDKPCDNCPFNAYINHECTKFSSMKDCNHYFKWFNRNEVKKSLASNQTSSISSVNSEVQYDAKVDDKIFSKEIYKLINSNIPVSMREDWIRFSNKLKISKQKREQMIEFIFQILKENGIEPETW